MNLVFLGPPGSGKGTQAVRLSQAKGVVHLSTGDLLREAVKGGTELGRQAEGYMKKGELVPDALIIGLIEDKITGGELNNGFILDGFPRTVPQAESLKTMFEKNRIGLDKAVLIAVSDDEIVKRLSRRWFCPTCQAIYNYPTNVPRKEGICDKDGAELQRRPDDEEGVVRNRLEVYKKQTQPIEVFYQKESLLVEVSGEDTPDNVFQSVLKAVG
ncbi:MAG: adenylate kinase [candidate division Zixibacteria bacterium]|nr:adenylate kinase [candidate division Zixibacteria bacterium]